MWYFRRSMTCPSSLPGLVSRGAQAWAGDRTDRDVKKRRASVVWARETCGIVWMVPIHVARFPSWTPCTAGNEFFSAQLTIEIESAMERSMSPRAGNVLGFTGKYNGHCEAKQKVAGSHTNTDPRKNELPMAITTTVYATTQPPEPPPPSSASMGVEGWGSGSGWLNMPEASDAKKSIGVGSSVGVKKKISQTEERPKNDGQDY
ncbi:hypothetical protein BC826DRAFT_1178712 [Russula brevipes]|nr:hypothetical protein BC826DRAFT_1178712 [Russula brevipes]